MDKRTRRQALLVLRSIGETLSLMSGTKYAPGQARDEAGRFASGTGGGSGGGSSSGSGSSGGSSGSGGGKYDTFNGSEHLALDELHDNIEHLTVNHLNAGGKVKDDELKEQIDDLVSDHINAVGAELFHESKPLQIEFEEALGKIIRDVQDVHSKPSRFEFIDEE